MKRIFATALATASIFIASPLAAQRDFSEVEITSEELAQGVAVLFGAGGNMAVSHGEDGTILIDDQFAPLSEKIEGTVAYLGATPPSNMSSTRIGTVTTRAETNISAALAQRSSRITMCASGCHSRRPAVSA